MFVDHLKKENFLRDYFYFADRGNISLSNCDIKYCVTIQDITDWLVIHTYYFNKCVIYTLNK